MARRLRFKLSECDCNVYPGEKVPEVEDTPPTTTGNEDTKQPQTYRHDVTAPNPIQPVSRLPSFSLLREEGPIRAVISDDIPLLNHAVRSQTLQPNRLFSADGTPALTVATAFNNRTIMRLLLDEGFSIDCLAPSGQYQGLSPLHVACALGHTSAFNLLIDRGADPELVTANMMVNGTVNEGGQTCLHLAARQNHTYLCNIIVSMNRNLVDVTDKEGLSPLHVSCMLGHLSIVRLLLRSGCDVNIYHQANNNSKSKTNVTPILQAIRYKQFPSARLLLGKVDLNIKCDLEFGRGLAPLHLATIMGENQLVRDLLDNGADPDLVSGSVAVKKWRYDNESLKAIHIAAFKGYVDIFETLGGTNEIKDTNGPHVSPLCLAAANNQYDMVRYLLCTGYDVNQTISFEEISGFTALHVAAEMDYTDILEHLLLKKANPNLSSKTNRGKALYQTPLNLACLKQNIAAVKRLGPVTDWDLFAKNGSDPVLDSILLNQSEIVELLLNIKYEHILSNSKVPLCTRISFAIVPEDGEQSGNEDPRYTVDDIRRTSDRCLQIRLGCSKRYHSVMKLFFLCFSVDSSKGSGQPMLHRAASNCLAFPVLSFLLTCGADSTEQNEFGYTALHVAAENNNLLAVQALLLVNSTCPKPVKKKDLETEFVKHLGLEEPVSPALNMRNTYGQTALHIAARGGYLKLVEILVWAGVDVNRADENGRTAVHLACSMGWFAVSQFLISKANIEPLCQWDADRDRWTDMTPLHLAVMEKETDICNMLLDSGADINSCFKSQKSNCTTALHLAIFNREWDTTVMLISRGSNVNLTGSDASAPLMMALDGQAPNRVLKVLLEAGANPNTLSPALRGLTSPIEKAVSSICLHRREVVDMLLNFGADVNLIKPSGRTVLHEIVANFPLSLHSLKNFSYLLETSQRVQRHTETVDCSSLSVHFKSCICDFSTTDFDGNSILHTALNNDFDSCTNLLLKHLKNPVLLTSNGTGGSLLQVAVTKRKHDIVRHLLEMGASILDSMAWMQALKLEDEEMLLIFSEFAQGVVLDIPLDEEQLVLGSLLHYTVLHSSEQYFNRILSVKLVDVNGLDSLGRTSFYLAVIGNRTNLALSLLAKGASVRKALDYRDETGRDLLHITASTPQKMFVSLLSLYTPDINRRALRFESEVNVTPLHIAAIAGQMEVIDVLLRSGSDVRCTTSSGKDAKYLAVQHGHELISQKLDTGLKMFQDNDQPKASHETLLS